MWTSVSPCFERSDPGAFNEGFIAQLQCPTSCVVVGFSVDASSRPPAR